MKLEEIAKELRKRGAGEGRDHKLSDLEILRRVVTRSLIAWAKVPPEEKEGCDEYYISIMESLETATDESLLREMEHEDSFDVFMSMNGLQWPIKYSTREPDAF